MRNLYKAKRRRPPCSSCHHAPANQRQLQFESLEDRRLLAIMVHNANDSGTGSLRAAIAQANMDPGADIIRFDASVFTGGANSLIRLTTGELEITDTLTIDGSTATDVTVTGDANDDDIIDALYISDVEASGETLLADNSRVLYFSTTTGDLTLNRLTITGGRTTGDGEGGGGIRFDSSGVLALANSKVSGNSTTGVGSNGGGIRNRIGDLTLTSSTVSGNSTTGGRAILLGAASGGGISTLGGNVTLMSSTVRGNSTAGERVGGGGIHASSGAVTLIGSTVSGNSTTGDSAVGGGIHTSSGAVTLIGSTVSGNSTTGDSAVGGGIYTAVGEMTVTRSTISGNSSSGSGGGMYVRGGDLLLANSTVSGNHAVGDGAKGGGIVKAFGELTLDSSTVTGNTAGAAGGGVIVPLIAASQSTTIVNSIIAGNLRNTFTTSEPNDLTPSPNTTLTVSHSVIGVNTSVDLIAGVPNADGNYVGTSAVLIDPMLGPLADNGGPTLTHALLPGSLAIDAGPISSVYDYRLNTFADSFGTGGDLTPVGGTGALGGGVYDFGVNQGLQTQIPADNADRYSVEIYFKFDTFNAAPSYQKILDFGTADHPDAGLYVYTSTNGATNRLRYLVEDNGTSFFTGPSNLSADTWYHLVLTRGDDSASSPLTAYIDGQIERSFPENGGGNTNHTLGVFSEEGDTNATRLLTMFHSVPFGPQQGGEVDRIRIYDRPLDAVEIDALFNLGPNAVLPDLDTSEFDQRGFSFTRVVGGRIDIGAFESRGASPDFDIDGDVDGADFLAWQRGFGSSPAVHAEGDANIDGDVDGDDLDVWAETYGQVDPGSLAASVGSGHTAASDAEFSYASLIDAAIALSFESESSKQMNFAENFVNVEAALHNQTGSDLAFADSASSSLSATAGEHAVVASEYQAEASETEWLAAALLDRVFG